MTNMETDTRTTGARALDVPPGRHERGGHDTVRWSAAWVGALSALPVFLVLQLLVVAFGWTTPGSGVGGAGSGIISAILGIIALGIGGAASGAAGSRSASSTALLEGTAVWALTVVAIVALGVGGAGEILGAAGGLTGVADTGSTDPAAAVDTARSAAGWAAVWLGVSFLAAVGGATLTRDTGTGRTGTSNVPPR